MSEIDKNLLREHLFLIVYAQMICLVEATDEYATKATNMIISSILEDTGETIEEITNRVINQLLN